MIFKVFMHADKKRSGSLGETVTEMEAFVDVVMGKRTLYALLLAGPEACPTLVRPRAVQHTCTIGSLPIPCTTNMPYCSGHLSQLVFRQQISPSSTKTSTMKIEV